MTTKHYSADAKPAAYGHYGLSALSTIGFATGIYLAYKGKKKFWAYVGYSIGLAIVGSIVGYGIDQVIPYKTVPKTDEKKAPADTSGIGKTKELMINKTGEAHADGRQWSSQDIATSMRI